MQGKIFSAFISKASFGTLGTSSAGGMSEGTLPGVGSVRPSCKHITHLPGAHEEAGQLFSAL